MSEVAPNVNDVYNPEQPSFDRGMEKPPVWTRLGTQPPQHVNPMQRNRELLQVSTSERPTTTSSGQFLTLFSYYYSYFISACYRYCSNSILILSYFNIFIIVKDVSVDIFNFIDRAPVENHTSITQICHKTGDFNLYYNFF